MRCSRRALSLGELVFAVSLAVLVIGVQAGEILRQQHVLAVVAREDRARAALLNAYERLRAGALAPPPAGESLLLDGAPPGCELRLRRETQALDARLAGPDLVPVILSARWAAADGKARARELLTLIDAGGTR